MARAGLEAHATTQTFSEGDSAAIFIATYPAD
jgi:hypothetical protein